MNSLKNWMTGIGLAAGLLTTGRAYALSSDLSTLLPWDSNINVESSTWGLLENKSHIRNDGTPAQIGIVDSSGRVRLADTGQYSPTIAWDSLYMALNTHSSLLPRQLNEQSMSLGIPIVQSGPWSLGAVVGAGYSGNSPYNEGQAVYGLADITAQYQFNPRDSLVFGINYDGNRSVLPDVPLPTVEFLHETTKLTWGVGIYEYLDYRPFDRLNLELMYFPTDDGHADIDYRLLRWLHVYGLFASQSWAFHVDFYNHDQRLFFNMCRVEAGVRIITCPNFSMKLGGGYAFNQAFSQGYQSINETPVGQIANAAYISLNAKFKF